MHLKLLSKEYIEAVADLYKELFDYSVYSTMTTYDKKSVVKQLEESLETSKEDVITILLVTNTGMCVGALTAMRAPSLHNYSSLMAYELAFWVKPQYRTKATVKQILNAYYFWARKTGCVSAFIGKIKESKGKEIQTMRKLT